MSDVDRPRCSRTQPDQKTLIKWRQEKVLTLRAKGFTIDEIVSVMRGGNPDVKISHGTVVSDLRVIRQQINERLFKFSSNMLLELSFTLEGLRETIKEAWKVAEFNPEKKLEALRLIQECYVKRCKLMTDNETLVKSTLIIHGNLFHYPETDKMPNGQ